MADAISRESFVYSNAICKIGLLPARLPTTMVWKSFWMTKGVSDLETSMDNFAIFKAEAVKILFYFMKIVILLQEWYYPIIYW